MGPRSIMDKKPTISIIAALQKTDRGIGYDSSLLWKISEDLKRFKRLTLNHPIIMGRKTYESIGRPLPERTNIIITRNANYSAPGCTVCSSIDEAIAIAKKIDSNEIFIIGGGEIYTAALPMTDRLYLTLVDAHEKANVFFPDYSEFKHKKQEEDHSNEPVPYSYVQLERV